MNLHRAAMVAALAALLTPAPSTAQITYDRILDASSDPGNWLTYNGTYSSQRHSGLAQITPDNVDDLELKWMLPNQVFGAWQTNPIVDDGIMYITQRPNDVMAVDAATGRVFWLYRHTPADGARICCGANNRGVAVLDERVFMGTLDARLIALDAVNGQELWNIEVADVSLAYSITMAPLVVKDKVPGRGWWWRVRHPWIRRCVRTWRQVKRRGASTRSPAPANPDTRRGRVTTGSTVAPRSGLRARSTPT